MIFLSRHKLRGMAETAAWLAGRRRRVRVVGQSMVPTLAEGEYVLVDDRRRPEPGQLALATHPDRPDVLVIKRVGAVLDDGSYRLISDNPDLGTDSRTWGPVAADGVLGTVTVLLDRPSTRLDHPNTDRPNTDEPGAAGQE